jgi:hypothetical protein
MIIVPGIELAVHDCILDDVPDILARPVAELVRLARHANAHCDETRYAPAGQDFGAVLTELHVHAATGDSDTRRAALAALVEACLAITAASSPSTTLRHGRPSSPATSRPSTALTAAAAIPFAMTASLSSTALAPPTPTWIVY